MDVLFVITLLIINPHSLLKYFSISLILSILVACLPLWVSLQNVSTISMLILDLQSFLHSEYISIVMFSASMGAKSIMAQCCSYTRNLICSNTYAYSVPHIRIPKSYSFAATASATGCA